MKNITIIGAGNLGSILAAKFSLKNNVCLYTNIDDQLPLLQKDLVVNDLDTNTSYKGQIKEITNDLSFAVNFAEYIFITFPSFLFEQLSVNLIPLLKKGQHLVFIPGSGGAEFYFHKVLEKGVTITGLQRVHCVARIVEMGKLVNESGKKNLLKVASIPSSFNETACKDLNEFYDIEIHPLKNYLNITLINSNPTLHTSRLYCLFKDYHQGVTYDRNPLFYEEWDLPSANLLSDVDDELTSMFPILEKHGLPIDDIMPIVQYYDSKTPEQMMNKLRSIKGFKGLYSPMVKTDNGYIPDFNSRYFTADFPFGLDILLEISKLLGTPNKNMQMISNWYHAVSGNKNSFSLEKLGIKTFDDFIKIYR